MRRFLADDPLAVDDAGAVDEPVQSSVALDSGGNRTLSARLVGDDDAWFLSDAVALWLSDIQASLTCALETPLR